MKKVFYFVIILILLASGWYFRSGINRVFGGKLTQIKNNAIVQQIKDDISNPPPLISNLMDSGGELTQAGTIKWTNTNRAENGDLPALTENAKLDKAAELKLQDMFAKQYFEHVNPQGVGPGDLAKKAGYEFISEGENLALGNFKDDQDLLTAWMNSPGHRANILNSKYMEIGVAVGQGTYQGHKTWLAVQEFGKPASSCPEVNIALKTQINALEAEIKALEPQIQSLKSQMDASTPQSPSEYSAYNQIVAQYNSVVKIYNNRVDSLKQVTSDYNNEVNSYNACLKAS